MHQPFKVSIYFHDPEANPSDLPLSLCTDRISALLVTQRLRIKPWKVVPPIKNGPQNLNQLNYHALPSDYGFKQRPRVGVLFAGAGRPPPRPRVAIGAYSMLTENHEVILRIELAVFARSGKPQLFWALLTMTMYCAYDFAREALTFAPFTNPDRVRGTQPPCSGCISEPHEGLPCDGCNLASDWVWTVHGCNCGKSEYQT